MKENKLINILSILFITGHFSIIIEILALRFIGWYDTPAIKICLPIIVPLFAAYTTVIINYYVVNKSKTRVSEDLVNIVFAFIAIFIPLVFICIMGYILYYQAVSPMDNDDFTFFLGLGELIFGVYLGILVKSIYGATPPLESKKQTESQPT
ncbi:hypothetical protein [Taibaiella soli]|uniref:Uncharacterized protein n=1 Tax=Taibaiella soli TaxID=1649169 RepID=A0A2W2AAZ9_9BACT|nr:hypothetical protein [Taibaiella soli]PZF72565.1 hypothetical protein DN068_11920 [Taibaiella soli]